MARFSAFFTFVLVFWLGQSACFVLDDFVLTEKCGGAIDEKLACSDPVSITAGRAHTCFLRNNKTAWCWGDHRKGQLGFAEKFQQDSAHTPKKVDDLRRISSLSAGWEHTCAVNDERLWCWGSNWRGQLGISPADQNGFTRQASKVPGTEAQQWKSVTSGGLHSCAVTTEDEVWCWGDNRYGQTGQLITPGTDWKSPKPIEGLTNVERVSAGLNHTCAHTKKEVKCWGQPNTGKTTRSPDDNMDQWHSPDSYALGSTFVDISAGKYHSCVAQGDDGAVICWGSRDHGQIGELRTDETDTSTQTTPQIVSWNQAMPKKIVQLAAGARHTCAIDENDLVYCWGGNKNFQLGDTTREGRAYPRPVGDEDETYQAKRIAAGEEHACLLDASGGISCWGLNQFGQSGQPWIEGTMESQREVRTPQPLTLPDPKDAEPPPPDSSEPNPDPTAPPVPFLFFGLTWIAQPALCITQVDDQRVDAPESLAPVLDFPPLKEKEGNSFVHTATITFTNCGADDLVLSEFTVFGSAAFSIDPPTISSTIVPGAEFTVQVKYEDTERVDRDGVLTLETNIPGQEELSIALSGKGLVLPTLCYEKEGPSYELTDDLVFENTDPITLILRLCENDQVPFVFRMNAPMVFDPTSPSDPSPYSREDPDNLPNEITSSQTATISIQLTRSHDDRHTLKIYSAATDPMTQDDHFVEIGLTAGMNFMGTTPTECSSDQWQYTHIAAGLEHTCVFKAGMLIEDELICWGNLFDENAHENNFRTPATRLNIDLGEGPEGVLFRRELKDIQAGEGYTWSLPFWSQSAISP